MITEKTFDEYDLKLSEWRGYVVRALEDINREQVNTLKKIQCVELKIDAINDKITNLKVKVAGIGAGSGLVVSLVLWLITKI